MNLINGILLTGAVGGVSTIGVANGATQTRVNIVYIFTDQQTATAMSCAGNRNLNTPNMDRLARSGVRFTNAYCAAPLSTPSRAAMFTGLTPGAIDQLSNKSLIPEKQAKNTLGHILSNAGYECAYAGKWHLPSNNIPDKIFGFDSIYPHNDRGLAEACEKFIAKRHSKPFFLVASFDNPHNICEYARGQELPFAKVTEPPIEQCPNLPANFAKAPYSPSIIDIEQQANCASLYPTVTYTIDDWRRYRNAYFRLVEEVDQQIGKILSALDAAGVTDQTLIIFSSDHGDGGGSHRWNQKSALYEEVINIPFIVKFPQNQYAGTVSEILINNGIDLIPSLCEAAGVVAPEYCKGLGIRSLLQNGSASREYIVTETLFDRTPNNTKGWAVRTPKYKYVLYDKGQNREQLFDMTTDRGEMVNLAVESSYREELNRHRKMLQQWVKDNGINPGKGVMSAVK